MPIDKALVRPEHILVDHKKLPFFNNKALHIKPRRPEKNKNYLELLPLDILRELFNKLSAEELKALAATSTRFLRVMMKTSTRKRRSEDYYPYLQEIYVSNLIDYLNNNKPMMQVFNRFKTSNGDMPENKAIEQALSRVIKLDKQIMKQSVRFYKRKTLRGKLYDIDGEIENTRQNIGLMALESLGFILLLLSLVFFPNTLIGVVLLATGFAFMTFLPVIIVLSQHLLSILLKTKDPLETIDLKQEAASDMSADEAEHSSGINNDEKRDVQDSENNLLTTRRNQAPANYVLREHDDEDQISETSPLLRRN